MKIFRYKKLFIQTMVVAAVGLSAVSCMPDEEMEYTEKAKISQGVTDPYLQINTPVIGFQAGIEDYAVSLNAINGAKSISEVKVYSVFTDAGSGETSNEVLLTSFPVTSPTRTVIDGKLTYDDLKAGITVGGEPLPEDQNELKVGSGWKLRFTGISAFGELPLGGSVTVAVLSRFAGIYKVKASVYYRIGVEQPASVWTGQERFIGSVSETVFSYNDYWGPFAWTGNQFNFEVNFGTEPAAQYPITAPIIVDGIYSGTYAMSCNDDTKGDFSKVSCTGSNVLIPDDATKKHVIKLTYGYFTASGAVGPREFQETLEKIVD
jgi:hypothetical protein